MIWMKFEYNEITPPPKKKKKKKKKKRRRIKIENSWNVLRVQYSQAALSQWERSHGQLNNLPLC